MPLPLTQKERRILATLLLLLLLGLLGMLLLDDADSAPPRGPATSFARPAFGGSAGCAA